jgi:hypothetical protein
MDDPTEKCPVCGHKYSFIRVRYTLYDEKGNKFDECGPCGIKREKQKRAGEVVNLERTDS